MKRKRQSTRPLFSVERLEDRLCMSAVALDTPLTKPTPAAQAQIGQAYGQLPLSFEANQGQADSQVNFLSRGNGYSLFLTPTQAVLNLSQGSGVGDQGSGDDVLQMHLVGGNPGAQPVAMDQRSGVSNYLIGNDPGQWHTNVPNFARVAYQEVYPGVKLVYYGNNQQRLEYDFVLAAGANPKAIQLSFQGAKGLSLDSQGNLRVKTSGGEVVEQAPVVYQNVHGARQAVSGRYVLEAGNQVGFQVGVYDATQPLVIDPTYSLGYSTYLGGSDGSRGIAIAVDRSGDAYVTGIAYAGFPTTTTAFQHRYNNRPHGGAGDVFVTKLNASGTGLVYSTYLGGTGGELGTGIAVDSAGNAYVAGSTYSTDFPTKNAYQASLRGASDAFLAKLNASGSALLYSTYLGGSSGASGNGVALDGSGAAFVTGYTGSTNFPTTPGAYQTTSTGTTDPFVAKLNTTLSGNPSLVYSTYLGSGEANGIAVDSSGATYVTGYDIAGGASSVIVRKLNPSGSALMYSITLGGNGGQIGNGIAVDNAGAAYVTGYTYSTNFPTTPGAFQTAFPSSEGPFVTKLDATGSVVYSTYLDGNYHFVGGSGDAGNSIAVDASGDAYVTGVTLSTTFPTSNAFQPVSGGNHDAFVTELNPTGSGLVFSSYLGGSDLDAGNGIAVDSSGNTYVTGYTYGFFPTTTGAFQTTDLVPDSTTQAFVTKITRNPSATSTAVSASVNPSIYGTAVVFTAAVGAIPAGSGAPTGSVSFMDFGNLIGHGTLSAGRATFSTVSLSGGNHALTTVYTGDRNFLGSTSRPYGEKVNPATTSTVVKSSLNPSVHGQAVTFTALVRMTVARGAPPTGTVVFKDGSAVLGSAPLTSSQSTFSTAGLAVGNHVITAVYGGDKNYSGSTSGAFGQAVHSSSMIAAVSLRPLFDSARSLPSFVTATEAHAGLALIPANVDNFFAAALPARQRSTPSPLAKKLPASTGDWVASALEL